MQAVVKSYHGRPALRGVSTHIDRSEFVFLTGPSGAGKSTFLRLLYRAELPDSGRIVVDGFDLAEIPRRQVADFRRPWRHLPDFSVTAHGRENIPRAVAAGPPERL